MTWFYQSAPGGGGWPNERDLGEIPGGAVIQTQWSHCGAGSTLAVEPRSCKLPGEAKSESASTGSNSLQPVDCGCQGPLSVEFSRQEYCSGLPFPSPGTLPNPGIEPRSSAVQAASLPSEPSGKPKIQGKNERNVLHHSFFFPLTVAKAGISMRKLLYYPLKVLGLRFIVRVNGEGFLRWFWLTVLENEFMVVG